MAHFWENTVFMHQSLFHFSLHFISKKKTFDLNDFFTILIWILQLSWFNHLHTTVLSVSTTNWRKTFFCLREIQSFLFPTENNNNVGSMIIIVASFFVVVHKETDSRSNGFSYSGSVLDQQKDVSLLFRRDVSRCYAAGLPVSSKNKDMSFCWSRTDL